MLRTAGQAATAPYAGPSTPAAVAFRPYGPFDTPVESYS